ncbi:hypothetical protein R5H32_13095 [Defluviimonas sp. D31]|uniref:hypothetical protein n=1 Tax=Defluviimonas sp. D31 TaxID=3083253 RepID=UPI00296F7727|nr:hypothetical protein [Defluviimonas sp. D31]MDW4550293.1 hypothetical protein [Defluviimonas sp. D31]
MTEAEKARFGTRPIDYISRVTWKFSSEIGVPMGSNPPLTPIEPHEWPTEFRTDKTYRNLGSFISLAGIMAVTTPMKDLLERIDPGMHQFHPSGSPCRRAWSTLNPTTFW